jgi:hypothetical protein
MIPPPLYYFEDISDEYKEFVGNGCGPKVASWIPELSFTSACQQHDLDYWLGGTEDDRKIADLRFYHNMIETANRHSWLDRWFYKSVAWIYYQAVKRYGSNEFEYLNKSRTLDELLALFQV